MRTVNGDRGTLEVLLSSLLIPTAEDPARVGNVVIFPGAEVYHKSLVTRNANDHCRRDVVLLLVGLDNSTEISSTDSHPAMAELSQLLAVRIREVTRGCLVSTPLGDMEYAVLCDYSTNEPAVMAHDVVAAIRPPLVVNDTVTNLTASVGVARWEDEETLSDFIQRADVALDLTRRLGGDGFRCSDRVAGHTRAEAMP